MNEENYQNTGEITLMIRAIQDGSKEKVNELIPATIKKIRRIAKQQLYKHKPNNDVTVTSLVHDLYIKVRNYANEHDSFLEKSLDAKSDDFFALCTTIIQNLIYDHCRRSKNMSQETDSLDDITKNFSWLSSKESPIDVVLIVKEALLKFKQQGFERQGKVIIYKYFGGFTDAEIGEILGISIPTVQRDLRSAESKLYFILNPKVKEICEQAFQIQCKDKQERFIEENCGNDKKLQKAIKLLVRQRNPSRKYDGNFLTLNSPLIS